jgi:hypothetical protein
MTVLAPYISAASKNPSLDISMNKSYYIERDQYKYERAKYCKPIQFILIIHT